MRFKQLAEKLPAAGFGLGSLAWLASTEFNYALAPKQCVMHWPLVPLLALLLALVGAVGIWLSAIAWRKDRPLPSPDRPAAGVPTKLLAGIGVLAGALFTAIIVMQGIAGFFLSGCE